MVQAASPGARRSISRQTPRGLTIEIPAKRNFFMILFGGFWLCGWALGEAVVTRMLFFEVGPAVSNLFALIWLGLWTVAGVAVGASWAWTVAGRTVLEVANGMLTLRHRVFGLGFSRAYDARQIKRLQTRNRSNSKDWAKSEGPFAGPIGFDYGARTVRFGAALDWSEAKMIIDELREALQLARDEPEAQE